MRITYEAFNALLRQAAEKSMVVCRQYVFVPTLPDPPPDESPVTGDPGRVWAVVDDLAVIEQMRTFVPAEDRIYVNGEGKRIDYDPVQRPVLIVHDVL